MTISDWYALIEANPADWDQRRAFSDWLMEELDLPESDRDEIRRMAEFLRWRHDNKEALEAARKGGPKVPIDPALKKWLLGEDQA